MSVCNQRKDKWADEIRVRISSAVSDLHAADARYHDDCRKLFMSQRSIKASVTNVERKHGEQEALSVVT